MSGDTIFALGSGQLPAALGVMRISGPGAGEALQRLAGVLPAPRRASLRRLIDPRDGAELDRALVLWFPGSRSATGEDCAELHLHGGRAVAAAVESALAAQGLRRAEPGEFTRRAFANGRLDLAEVEGLADLLAAETELQRRSAQAMAGGALSRAAQDWREGVLTLSARLEASLDFSDESDVDGGGDGLPDGFGDGCRALAASLGEWLDRPRAEPLREGFRVVLAGPPNAGKSTLFNALVESEAAIISAEPGTTRDVLVSGVALGGVPFSFVDTAGLRDEGAGTIEAIGIARARAEAERADLVLWLGPEGLGPVNRPLWEIAAQCDRRDGPSKSAGALRVSARTGEGLGELRAALIDAARRAMPAPGQAALNRRQAQCLGDARQALDGAARERDPLLAAECLRLARRAVDALVGRTDTEAMLDALFGRFCIGK
ncbi:tRNA uridine-5-carboxymethylaminomethyl(34) synthesis GTPase MnmE [Novosphingobium sp. Fuku2-ISO-50]|uniref:tRNA uridine-5-carboxymethylaminomethyl(34) synthesis GTPase MnmE n=1 Tax=Novosphingobium sp. Fuku2-ISO-50 TaxID=1739114 RepID=UPI00076DBCE7|nr:tRNA uridine-5-carboxymethylaminomethyl(34) synthesis GTPase MnmE [Novosphingobium sp. Fuku2-ISO-50]KUR77297.1 tRNA modification GTPase TrmE [Novosphingobium sp. Fuku2-ISO-50]